ncbi:TetR/AcrR family transcriptional regulator [Desulfuribacillus alkaliarsenatis]|uniref:HTH tetR-type domain-containing protein n=1 Tax=Desulfuribacillus alkaliarsenatis TaxID=766136 RepID=A0A1E5G3I1_9FIRM|nr:TetR/AcrR family transcriptional regulator [Desulfuribacillus alkaliarsenatis]OEF97648.1 hypothetical protein BHF68_14475 [Desulfuribacillus alkaliarsenatis]
MIQGMTKKEVREKKRREQILEAALTVFSENGFHNTKVEEIARVAGIGKGTIYEYFESKADIFKSMLLSIMQKYVEAIEGQFDTSKSSWDNIIGMVDVIFNMLESQTKIHRLIMLEHTVSLEEFTPLILKERAKKIGIINKAIIHGQQTGEFNSDLEPTIVAEVIISSIESVVGTRMIMEQEIDLQTMTEQLQAVYRKILNASP